MKVVLFCGGLGTRLREYPDPVPKPMIQIGYRPILWHVMKYYAHYGYRDFILCLGYKADVIKNYFLNYNECVSNNFVLERGGRELRLLNRDIDDWRITFVDTGVHASVGQRLKAIAPYLEGESAFLANYSDGVTDLHLPTYVNEFQSTGRVASFLAVRPTYSFHVVNLEDDAVVSIDPVAQSGLWINGGFFAFRTEIFNYIEEGEELVETPFNRLIASKQIHAYKYDGFWACMDTFKDKARFEELHGRGDAPWEVWLPGRHITPKSASPARANTACACNSMTPP